MSDVEYEFKKGEGWVPKKPTPKLSDYVQIEIKRREEVLDDDDLIIEFEDFEPNYVTHRGINGDIYREYRPRLRPQLTFDQFVQRLIIEEYAFETSLRYRCANGQTLGYRVDRPPRHQGLYEISLHRAQQDMYREAGRRGF